MFDKDFFADFLLGVYKYFLRLVCLKMCYKKFEIGLQLKKINTQHNFESSGQPEGLTNVSKYITQTCPCNLLQYFTAEKNDNFQMKIFDIFLIFAQNIDSGYTLEPPQ